METVIGACGLVCGQCGARIATLAGDREGIEKVAAKWREIHSAGVTGADVWCKGCMSAEGPKCTYTSHCNIRKCVVSKGHSTCADCADYACDELQGFHKHVLHAKAVLDALRLARKATA